MTVFSRFSLCNCLTTRMDKAVKGLVERPIRTYTAYLMTTDVFLHRAHAGENISVPFKLRMFGQLKVL